VGTERLVNNPPNFVPSRVIAEQQLKACLRLLLEVARRLLVHKIDAIPPVKHEGTVLEEPLAEGGETARWLLQYLA
jgi:hypothetical protein